MSDLILDLAGELTERLVKHVARDREFENRFGRWRRPEFARRYPLDEMKHLIRFSPDGQVLDAGPFVLALAPEDRYVAADVARFTFEEFQDAPATDKTLNLFRLHLLRRLDVVGF